MRNAIILGSASVLLSVIAVSCSVPPGAVRGFESGGYTMVAERRVLSATTEGLPPAGSASYVGASDDGSVMYFLGSDGVMRYYRSR